MKKKVIIVVICLVLALVLVGLCVGRSDKGTIREFVDEAVIVATDDGKKVIRVEDYQAYVQEGEQWSVGDRLRMRNGLFTGFSVRLLEK